MSERTFQELHVERLAEVLANRMESVLISLLREQRRQQQQQQADQGSPTMSVELSECDRATLRRVFTMAVEVKCKLLLSKDTFNAIMHPPRTPIDDASMAMSSDQRLPQSSRRISAVARTVQLTLLPEIRCFASDKLRVDYDSFSSTASTTHGGGKCLTQAVVLVAM